jgi:predicted RNA-binding Zn ribbon-like protein
MPVRMPFLFLGGAPALDFVNTELVLRGDPVDLLGEPEDLIRWTEESGLAGPEAAMEMRAAPPETRRQWLEEGRALRAELRKSFLRLAGGGALRAGDVGPIDSILARGRYQLRAALVKGRVHADFERVGAFSPVEEIARSVADLFASSDVSLIRRCEGSGCILLFLDTTKSHTRRWCSMAYCGNRAKAAAHYRRRKAAKRSSGSRGVRRGPSSGGSEA